MNKDIEFRGNYMPKDMEAKEIFMNGVVNWIVFYFN